MANQYDVEYTDIIKELSIGDASALPPYAEEAEPDAYEKAAREAGWQHDGGIFHPNRDGNNTGDDAEYADTWREACDISQVGPDHEAMAELPIPFSPPSAADALAQIAARLRGENADPHSDLESDIAAIVRAAQGKEG